MEKENQELSKTEVEALQPIPDGLVVLTFDDGNKSDYTYVGPLLKHYSFGATFFITEGLNFLNNKAHYVTWEEIRQLHEEGFEIGNHTRHHKHANTQSKEELLADLIHIDERCEEYGIPVPETFGYPADCRGTGSDRSVVRKRVSFRAAWHWTRSFHFIQRADVDRLTIRMPITRWSFHQQVFPVRTGGSRIWSGQLNRQRTEKSQS